MSIKRLNIKKMSKEIVEMYKEVGVTVIVDISKSDIENGIAAAAIRVRMPNVKTNDPDGKTLFEIGTGSPVDCFKNEKKACSEVMQDAIREAYESASNDCRDIKEELAKRCGVVQY